MDGTKSTIPVRPIESTDLLATPADANLSSDFGLAEESHPSDLRRLGILKGRLRKARRLCLLLDRSFPRSNHLIQKACDWYLTDERVYYRDRRALVDVLAARSAFLEGLFPMKDSIARLSLSHARQLDELETVIETLRTQKSNPIPRLSE